MDWGRCVGRYCTAGRVYSSGYFFLGNGQRLDRAVRSEWSVLLMPGASSGSYEASLQWIPDPIVCAVLVGIATAGVGMFRTRVQNSILPVATVVMVHSSMLCVLTVLDGRLEGILVAFGVFGVSSIWFVTRGDPERVEGHC